MGIVIGDISRLLRLLQHYPAAKKFLLNWQAAEGMSFVGMSGGGGLDPTPDELYEFMNFREFQQAMGVSSRGGGDNDEMDGWTKADLSPLDLAQLQHVHGDRDPFPMTNNFEVLMCMNDCLFSYCLF